MFSKPMGRLAATAAALGLLALPAGAPAAILSSDPTAANVNAYGGLVVWTRTDVDPEGLSTYRLVAHGPDGVAADLPLRGFTHRVDADLGPDLDGGVVAVYDRCRSGACDLYRYSFVTGREQRVRSASTRRRAESAASVWEERLSFLRYAVTIGFHAGFRGAGVYSGAPPRRLTARMADQTDTQGSAIAYSTGSRRAPSAVTRVHVLRLSGRRARLCKVALATTRSGAGFRVREPVLSGAHVYWLHVIVDGGGAEYATVRRMAIPGRRCGVRGPVEQLRGFLPAGTRSLAVDGEHVYATAPGGVGELSSPVFEPVG